MRSRASRSGEVGSARGADLGRTARGALFAGLALLVVLSAGAGGEARGAEDGAAQNEEAQDGAAPQTSEVVDYAKLLAPDRSGEGVIARTRRETLTYPYIERAQRLIARGDLTEARKDLDVYLERDPHDLSARFTYGVLAASLGDSHVAAAAMTKVLEGRPGFGPALLYRAVARQKDGDEAGALADYEAAAKSDVLTPADRARALDSAAQVAVNLDQNDVALRALDELDRLEGARRSAERDLLHASLLAESGDDERAVDLLERWTAAGEPPRIRVEALRRISVLAAEAGRLDEARAAAEEGARLEPNDPSWPERLAEIASRQGDTKAAVAYRRDAAREGPSVERERALSVTEEQAGERSAALASARAVVEKQGEATAQADLLRLAVLESESGEPLDAAALYEAAWRMGPDRDPMLLVRAAREYRRGGDAEAASNLLEQVANDGGAPARLRGEALAELADLDMKSGRDDAARAALERAIALGGGTWAVRQTLGDLQLRSGDARAALATFREALRLRTAPRTRLGIGYAYAKLGKPGLAVHEIDRALAQRGDGLSAEARLEALRTAGYLQSEIGDAARAAAAWSSAQSIRPDTEIALGLARAERLSGDRVASARTLDGVSPASLAPAQGARYWDERSALAESAGDRETAEAGLRRAIALEASPARDERLGVLLAESGRPDEARPLFAQALEKGGFHASWASALGHVDSDLDDPEGASTLFARSLAADPDQLSLYEDLGYAHLREFENEKAIRRFEEAIDNRPLYPVETEAERKALDRRIERLRREVTEVDRWISLVAYTSICFGDSHCRLGETALVEGASESQGGAELAIRPPVIGFRNGRIFEIISRVLFQQEVNSIEPIGSSTVATLGVRYKPFRTHDFYASIEKIFGVGSDTTGNTLLRGSYGWLRGYRMKPGVSHWSYTNLYGDLSYTVEYPRNWFFYAEARQGVTFNYADRAMLTPLLYLRNRNLGGDGDDDYNDVDLGAGVSARWLWNDDRYHDYRSSFEILPRIGYDAYNSDGRGWNIFLTAVVQF